MGALAVARAPIQIAGMEGTDVALVRAWDLCVSDVSDEVEAELENPAPDADRRGLRRVGRLDVAFHTRRRGASRSADERLRVTESSGLDDDQHSRRAWKGRARETLRVWALRD